jgi:SSS family solute:Na+ symporter
MISKIDLWIVIAYLVLTLLVGFIASGRNHSLAQYSVAGRNFSWPIIFATLSASYIGGGFTTGNAEKVFSFGLLSAFALWGFSLKEILVAKIIVPRMERFRNMISVGQIMGSVYGRWAQILTGFFGTLLCAGIMGAQVGAMGYVFELFLGIDRWLGILIGCGIVIIYTTVGGMRAVIYTDVMQFAILVIGIPLALILAIIHLGGPGEFISVIPASHIDIWGQMTPFAFIILFLSFLVGETLVPPYVQRLLIGKNLIQTSRGTFYSGLFSIPFFVITGLIGLVALVLNPGLNPNLALPYVVQTVLPVGLEGLVVAAIIAIVMSSADSFLNSASVNITNDIIKPLFPGEISEKGQLRIAMLTTLIVGILAVIFAVNIPSILDVLLFAYKFWAPVILVPLVAALLGKHAPSYVFLGSALVGFLATWLTGFYIDMGSPYELCAGVFGSLVVFVALYLFKGEKVENFSAS